MIMDLMTAVHIGGRAIGRSSFVRVDGAVSQDLTFFRGRQRAALEVVDNFDVHFAPWFQQICYLNLPARATSTFSSSSPRAEIVFIDFNLSGEGLAVIQR